MAKNKSNKVKVVCAIRRNKATRVACIFYMYYINDHQRNLQGLCVYFHFKMKFSDEILWLKLTWMEQLLCKMRFSQIKYKCTTVLATSTYPI